ncbi:60S ribosomal protein L33B [Kalmusia sp. IMI 367209]|nr:60S ribosomal protein L33B [Kalmusia sp. IMI 367209]
MASETSHRLYVKGRHLGYQRGKRNTNPNVSLLALEGVGSTEEAEFYLGKRVAFVYRAHTEVRGTKHRVVWGKIRSTHGDSIGGGGTLQSSWECWQIENTMRRYCRRMGWQSGRKVQAAKG